MIGRTKLLNAAAPFFFYVLAFSAFFSGKIQIPEFEFRLGR
jgi:hypothetical protein